MIKTSPTYAELALNEAFENVFLFKKFQPDYNIIEHVFAVSHMIWKRIRWPLQLNGMKFSKVKHVWNSVDAEKTGLIKILFAKNIFCDIEIKLLIFRFYLPVMYTHSHIVANKRDFYVS